MNNLKESTIKLHQKSKRLEEIQTGQCSKEFEEKAKEIYPQELRQADAESIKAGIAARFDGIAEKYQ